MLMQESGAITDLPLGKMTSAAVAVIALVGIIMWFAWKHSAGLYIIIDKLIDKIDRR